MLHNLYDLAFNLQNHFFGNQKLILSNNIVGLNQIFYDVYYYN